MGVRVGVSRCACGCEWVCVCSCVDVLGSNPSGVDVKKCQFSRRNKVSEEFFFSSRKCVEPDFLFGAKIQTAISPLAETGATRSIRLVSVQCKEREKMTFLVRFFFF